MNFFKFLHSSWNIFVKLYQVERLYFNHILIAGFHPMGNYLLPGSQYQVPQDTQRSWLYLKVSKDGLKEN